MNVLALLLTGYLALSAEHGPTADTTGLWNEFKAEYGKEYDNKHVESMRRIIFERNLAYISQHHHSVALHKQNNSGPSYSIGLNRFADLSDAEMASMRGFELPANYEKERWNTQESNEFLQSIYDDNTTQIPEELDWRKVPGRVSPVSDEGFCKSSWAFAAAGALEGQEALRLASFAANGSDPIELSVQNLMDCTSMFDGCHGGFMAEAFESVRQIGGIDDAKSYPYEALRRYCRFQKSRSIISSVKGAAILPEGDENKLKEVVAKFGPVAVGVNSFNRDFFLYKGGVLDSKDCSNKADSLNQALLVVGYGTDPKAGDYWIAKNSVGSNWGETGYIRLARNKNNMCGIASVATIPTF